MCYNINIGDVMNIKIGTLTIHNFDKNNKTELEFIKNLCNDDTIKTRFQGIFTGLLNDTDFFNRGFLVSHNNNLVGYLHIGALNPEENCVYLRAAVDKNSRGMNYGKTILSEITEYIFKNFEQVESIRLKIASDNKASLMTSNACGYKWLENDFYIKYNPYLDNKKTK